MTSANMTLDSEACKHILFVFVCWFRYHKQMGWIMSKSKRNIKQIFPNPTEAKQKYLYMIKYI
jgi:hypothetical protein